MSRGQSLRWTSPEFTTEQRALNNAHKGINAFTWVKAGQENKYVVRLAWWHSVCMSLVGFRTTYQGEKKARRCIGIDYALSLRAEGHQTNNISYFNSIPSVKST